MIKIFAASFGAIASGILLTGFKIAGEDFESSKKNSESSFADSAGKPAQGQLAPSGQVAEGVSLEQYNAIIAKVDDDVKTGRDARSIASYVIGHPESINKANACFIVIQHLLKIALSMAVDVVDVSLAVDFVDALRTRDVYFRDIDLFSLRFRIFNASFHSVIKNKDVIDAFCNQVNQVAHGYSSVADQLMAERLKKNFTCQRKFAVIL